MGSRSRLVTLVLVIIFTVSCASIPASRVAAPRSLETEPTETSPILQPDDTPVAVVVPAATPVSVEGVPNLGKFVKVEDGEHLSFYAEPDSYALHNTEDFAGEAETLLQEVSDKLGERLSRKVSFYLYGGSQGYFSALSFAGSSLIYQQFDARSSRLRSKAVAAHELAHQITFQSLGYTDSLVHLEGIAHWASESHWIRAEGRSFDERVRRYAAASRLLSLDDLMRDRSLWTGETQLAAYDEAGSFVGYLIQAYGLDKFKQVYMDSNYGEKYGKSLPDLEGDWLASLTDH